MRCMCARPYDLSLGARGRVAARPRPASHRHGTRGRACRAIAGAARRACHRRGGDRPCAQARRAATLVPSLGPSLSLSLSLSLSPTFTLSPTLSRPAELLPLLQHALTAAAPEVGDGKRRSTYYGSTYCGPTYYGLHHGHAMMRSSLAKQVVRVHA